VKRSEISLSDELETPDPLFQWAERRYGRYDIDVAAGRWNHKKPRFITKRENALVQRWDQFGAVDGVPNDSSWCNSPFSRGNKGAFAARGRLHVIERWLKLATHLLPHDTKDRYWLEHIERPELGRYFVEKEYNPFGTIWRTTFRHLVIEKVETAMSWSFRERHAGKLPSARFSVVLVTFAQPGVLPAIVQASGIAA
jgi:hypothetical protein